MLVEKKKIIDWLHTSVFVFFTVLWFVYTERSMSVSMLFHVDSSLVAGDTALQAYSLFGLTALMTICVLLGRFPHTWFARTLMLLYAVIFIFCGIHYLQGDEPLLRRMLLFMKLVLPPLIFLFSYNAAPKVSFKTIERGIGLGLIFLAIGYLLTFRKLLASFVLFDTFRDGTVYIFMMFLPFTMLFSSKRWRILYIIAICLSVASSLKRGGLVIIFLTIVAYYFSNNRIKERHVSGLWKIALAVFFFVAVVVGVVILDQQSGGLIFYRFSSIESDGGSGRDSVYLITFDMIAQSDLFSLIFGHGWGTVQKDSPLELSAHNDFLEITYDVGLIALLLLLLFTLQLTFGALRRYRSKSQHAPAYISSFIIFFLTSIMSHVFLYETYISILMFFWGYITAREEFLNDKKI